MAKIEIDILDDALEDSGDGDPEMELGMVEENSFGNDDVKNLRSQTFLDSTEDDVSYSLKDPSNSVTFRFLTVNNELETEMPPIIPDEVYPGGATIEKTPVPVQTLITNPVNGHVFVIGNHGELFTPASKTITPREPSNTKVPNIVKKRDDKRRATHNEVERRRRDKINNWIVKLSKLIPSNSDNNDKSGLEGQSKGGILAKACEYITEMKDSHQRYNEKVKENELLTSEILKLTKQVAILKAEKATLQYKLSKNGSKSDSSEVS